jgi:hypothetical protein
MTVVDTQALDARPGWTSLREAADELHAAELLVGDPLATPTTALPHLRAYWRSIAAAGSAAGIGKRDATDPSAWLDGEIVGLDAGARQALAKHVRSLDAEQAPSKRELRAHVTAARSLLARLEPEIGGVPLYRRKRRVLWSTVGTAVVLLPIMLYAALNTEVPGTGPWRAAYHADKAFESRPVVVREDNIEHDWNDTAPLEKIAPDKFSIRWDTCLRIDEAGLVVFQVHANDGARVFVDGELLIDAWDKNPTTRRRGFGSGELELEPGIHHLRVEYFESLGDASIKLSASLDGSLPGPLERDRLLYPGDDIDEQDPCAAVR